MQNEVLVEPMDLCAKLDQLGIGLRMANGAQQFMQCLMKMKDLLDVYTQPEATHINRLLFDILKPICRQIANSYIRTQDKVVVIKQVLMKIIKMYIYIFRKYYSSISLENLKELLSRDSFLFKKKSEALEGLRSQPQDQFQWTYCRLSTTPFYRHCCENIMISLNGIWQDFSNMKLSEINEYFSFLYYLNDIVRDQKLAYLCEQSMNAILSLFENPSKDTIKEANKQTIDLIIEGLLKIIQYSRQDKLKKKIDRFGPELALRLLKQGKVERKISGLKLLNKYSSSFYICSPSKHFNDSRYGQWMEENNIFELIYNPQAQLWFLKLADDIFSSYFRNKLIKQKHMESIFLLLEVSHQIRKHLFKLLDRVSLKFENFTFSIVIQKLKCIKKPDFYEEQFFNFIESLMRFQYLEDIIKIYDVLDEIIQQHYQSWSSCLKTRSIYTYVKLIHTKIQKYSESERKLNEFQNVVVRFYQQPTPLNILVMSKSLDLYPEISSLSKRKVSKFIIHKCLFLQQLTTILQQNPFIDMDIIFEFVKLLFKYYQNDQKEFLSPEQLFQMSKYPKIFCLMIPFVNFNNSFLQQLFKEAQNQQIEFRCIREIYASINKSIIKPISHYAIDIEYQIDQNPHNLICLPELFNLLETTKSHKLRKQCSSFIAELFTCYSESYSAKGQSIQLQFMKEAIQSTFSTYKHYKDTNSPTQSNKLKGLLSLIEELLANTQIFGVGDLKSHSSLVSTSTVLIKIQNEVSEGEDVYKQFQKRIPSNYTLFQVLTDVSKLFKCSPTDIMLRRPGGNIIPLKYNGMTLDEIQINGVHLIAIKSYRNKLKTAELFEADGMTLTKKAVQIFSSIYKTFAPEGRMGKKQCANYIEGVTQLNCSVYDQRVKNFFDEFDRDRDHNITMEEFIKFYENSCLHKPQVVWKNLKTLRYRRDLKRYDDPIDDIQPSIMMRYHLCQDNTIYQILFSIIRQQSSDFEIKQTCLKLLQRLPTYPKIISSLDQSLQILGRNLFQTQYILIAIQSKLNSASEDRLQTLKQLTQRYQKIFRFLQNIFSQTNLREDQKKSIAIALHILRSLVMIKSLNTQLNQKEIDMSAIIKIQKTSIFYETILKCLDSGDIEIFELAACLQLSQSEAPVDWLQSGIFHKQKDIRKITCNFILLHEQLNEYKIDLFGIDQKNECQQWFKLLRKLIQANGKLNLEQIFKKRLQKALNCSQSLNNLTFNNILYGNLELLKKILLHSKINNIMIKIPDQMCEKLIKLADNTIYDENRKLIYQLISMVDLNACLSFLNHLIQDTVPSKQIQRREKYVGIKNLGCTCYMNSILQQFFYIQNFRNLIMNLKVKPIKDTEVNGHLIKDDFLFQLQKIYAYLSLSHKKYYDPIQFCLTIKGPDGKPINTAIQQDAHEFLNKIFNNMEIYLKECEMEKALFKLFGGTTATVIRCQKCKNQNKRLEQFCHLSVEVKGIASLSQSLAKLTEQEEIRSDYHCDVCAQKVPLVTKRSLFNKLPDTLIINLQRIIFDIQTFENIKVSSRLQFPHQLNVKDYVDSTFDEQCNQYQLTGVVIHSGTSQSGHYYSLIKLDKQWYKFNDQSVTKFDQRNMARECFGGAEDTDQWGQLKFSTNAYILLYSKRISQNISQELNPENCIELSKQLNKENCLFYKQIQTHQQSLFVFANELFDRIKPIGIEQDIKINPYEQNWSNLKYHKQYTSLLQLYLGIMKFVNVYYELKNDVFYSMSFNIYCLFYLVPEKAYQFIMQIDCQQYLNCIISHNQSLVRQMYRTTLNKCLHIYKSYYGFQWKPKNQVEMISENQHYQKFTNILDALRSKLVSQFLQKNIFKSQNFFECLRYTIMLGEDVMRYALKTQILGDILDLLMGVQMVQWKKQQKRVDIPSSQSLPLMQIILMLVGLKKGLNGVERVYGENNGMKLQEFSYREKRILQSSRFYKKMIKEKHDQGILSPVIASLSYQNRQFTISIIETCITGLSITDSYESIIPIISYIRYLLIIQDSLTQYRIQWLLGIPQFQAPYKMEYSVRDISNSCIAYHSNIFFIQSQNYEPLLQRLYEKRYRYDTITITALIAILEIINMSQDVLNYILNIPPPSYNMLTYIDWIEIYTKKLEQQDCYGILKSQKEQYVDKLKILLKGVNEKIKQRNNLPRLEYIIGKNVNISPIDALQTQFYSLTVWRHQTYIFPNKIVGTNFTLPYQIAKYIFSSSHSDELKHNGQMKTEFTVITVQIKTYRKLKIKFNSSNFNYQIFTIPGTIEINLPYDSKAIHQLIDIQVIQFDQPNKQNTQYKINTNLVPNHQKHTDIGLKPPQNPIYQEAMAAEINCPSCTYINIGRQKCQMCDANLEILEKFFN